MYCAMYVRTVKCSVGLSLMFRKEQHVKGMASSDASWCDNERERAGLSPDWQGPVGCLIRILRPTVADKEFLVLVVWSASEDWSGDGTGGVFLR